MNEIWESIKGFEGLYEVSSLGNVRSVGRIVPNHGNKVFITWEHMMKVYAHKGYLRVVLQCNKKKTYRSVHLLVAEAFLEVHDDQVVHHIDFNKLNNRLDNLKVMNKSEHIIFHNTQQSKRKCNPTEIVELHLKGLSHRKIAEILNVGKTTVGKYIKRSELK